MEVNNSIIDLICVGGVPPEFFSGQPWKNFMAVTDPMTHTASASTFAHTYILAEATCITKEVFQKLRKQINLTISFDGGTTCAIQSIYIHSTYMSSLLRNVQPTWLKEIQHQMSHI